MRSVISAAKCCGENAIDRLIEVGFDAVLPNSEYSPAASSEFAVHTAITRPIGCELPSPKRAVRSRHCPMFWATMPKTAIHENGDAMTNEHEVRCARKVWVELIAHPFRPKSLPQDLLWSCVSRADECHLLALGQQLSSGQRSLHLFPHCLLVLMANTRHSV